MKILSQHLALIKALSALPLARLYFDSRIESIDLMFTYRNYTKRHPRYKLIQNKCWGAALVDLKQCGSREGYLERIKAKNWGGYHAKRARARGYLVAEIDRNRHVDAIHDINVSQELRQGRPMDAKYQEKQLVFDVLANSRYFGVLAPDGKLMAYATIGRYGNFSSFGQLMGYRNNDGIMHLMVSEIIARLIDQNEAEYVMYDTFFGALPGLQQFKTILGFQPYRARYSLT